VPAEPPANGLRRAPAAASSSSLYSCRSAQSSHFGGKATCLMAVGLAGRGVVALFASAALGWRLEAALGVVVVE